MSEGPIRSVPRTYTVTELLRDLKWVVFRLPALWSIWIGKRLPRALREQIIVAVAQANACPMCEHAHIRKALEAGVSDAELAALEDMDEGAFDRRTWLAIAHARERTKANFAPVDKDGEHNAVADALGQQTYDDVEDVARVMTVANRVANTLNALPARRRGQPVPGSRLPDELIINFMLLPGAWLGTLVAAARQRRSPFVVWREARGRSVPVGERTRKMTPWPWLLAGALALAIALLVGGLGPESLKSIIAARFPDVQWVDTETLAQWMNLPSPTRPVILDVRKEDEFAVSHLRGARRADPSRPNVDSLRIPEDATVVVYCSLGYRSAAIVGQLKAAGIDDVYNLEGGIFAWANEDRPVFQNERPAKAVHPYDKVWGRFLHKELWAPSGTDE